MPTRGNILAKLLCALTLAASLAFACSCPSVGPPCAAIDSSTFIFAGTILAIEKGAEGTSFATMRMDQVFKGSLPRTITLFDDGMCEGPELHVGGQYLLYTEQSEWTGMLNARGCTRSRALKDAAEDLAFLNDFVAGKTDTIIRGLVVDDEHVPLPNVLVSISRKHAKPQVTRTGSTGAFQFAHQPPGDYQIDIHPEGYDATSHSRRVTKGTCIEDDIRALADRRIFGTVRDTAGQPIPGLRVQLLPVHSSHTTFADDAVTAADGTYSFSRVPPGDYYVGTNLARSPSPDAPYPRLYYPDASTPERAQPISIKTGPNVHQIDLHMPPPLPVITIKGKILEAGGLPPLLDHHPGINIWDPVNRRAIWQDVDIHTDGHFELRLCQGVTYAITAFTNHAGSPRSSSPITITATPNSPELVLTLH